jgi:hypothetical protein
MQLYSDVRDGNVKISIVLSLMRTVGSALGKALSHSSDIGLYIYQPFYYDGAGLTKEEIDVALAKAKQVRKVTPKKPLHVLMKIMADGIDGQRFYNVLKHTNSICVTVRDPQSQLLSIYRSLNDMPSGQSISRADYDLIANDKTNMDNYTYSLWKAQKARLSQIKRFNHDNPDLEKNWCVVDGDLLRSLSEPVLRATADCLSIRYSSQMRKDWNESNKNIVGLESGRYATSWIDRVRNTSGLKQPTFMTPRLEDFHPDIRISIERSLRVYVWALAQCPPIVGSSQLAQLVEKGFHFTSPLACYTAISLLPNDNPNLGRYLIQIRDELPEFESSYKIISQAAKRCGGYQASMHSSKALSLVA